MDSYLIFGYLDKFFFSRFFPFSVYWGFIWEFGREYDRLRITAWHWDSRALDMGIGVLGRGTRHGKEQQVLLAVNGSLALFLSTNNEISSFELCDPA